MYSHPAIVVQLHLLFSILVHHGLVTNSFGNRVIIPVVKDNQRDLCNNHNYRRIALPCVSYFAKHFEHCILDKYDNLLLSNYLKFGFKMHCSCYHAFFVLRQVVELFVTHGGNVYMAALDVKKAFDRVHHLKLYNVLSDGKSTLKCLPQ